MYEQTINVDLSERQKTVLQITNFDEIPRYCFCRVNSSGYAGVTVYTLSEDGKYMIAEGDSDHTVFMLLEIIGKDGDTYVTKYINDATNPMDEMYSHLCGVSWYEEYGFCKLKFFNLNRMPAPNEIYRRIYFLKKDVG